MKKQAIEIIYEDNDILVINKPSGISVTKDRSGQEELQDVLKSHKDLLLVHRLDKPTSGVMLLAKNTDAQRTYSRFFEERLVKKTYLTLVTGFARESQGVIDAPLAQSKHDHEKVTINHKIGKEAVTEWRLLADFELYALLAVCPKTGRTHQIRVHLPSIGLPLAIDQLYGSSKPIILSEFKRDYKFSTRHDEKPLIERLTLHAYQLEFSEPVTGKPSIFIAGLDKKFAAAIKMLTKYCNKGNTAFDDPDMLTKILAAQQI